MLRNKPPEPFQLRLELDPFSNDKIRHPMRFRQAKFSIWSLMQRRGEWRGAGLLRDRQDLPQPAQRPAEVLQNQTIDALDSVGRLPAARSPVRARLVEPMQHGQEHVSTHRRAKRRADDAEWVGVPVARTPPPLEPIVPISGNGLTIDPSPD